MYPDLSYVFHDLFGTNADNWLSLFKTFGLLVATAVLTAAFLLKKELERRAGIGQFEAIQAKVITNSPITLKDHFFNALFGFALGFKVVYIIQHIAEMQADPAAVLLSTKGSWIGGIIGLVLFVVFYLREDFNRKKTGIQVEMKNLFPHHRIMDITTVAVISGVIGAKIFTVIEEPKAFFADPWGQLISGDGWTIYGGLIGGFIITAMYLRMKKIALIPFMDAVAPALIVSYGVGRLGCHFAGDGDWGIVAASMPEWWFLPDWLWSFDYPRNVLNKGVEMTDCVGKYCHQLSPKVYPTAVYETTMAFTIGAILWAVRKPLTSITGMLFAIYLVFNGLERFLIEGIRVNIRHETLSGLTQAESIAIGLIIIGIVMGIWRWVVYKKGNNELEQS